MKPGTTGGVVAALRDVSVTYPGSASAALAGVDLELSGGELVLVRGASGAGKTTLALTLNRAIPSYHRAEVTGEVWVAGRERTGADVADLAGVVGLVTQDFEAQLFSTNVLLEVAFGMEQLAVPRREMVARAAESLELVGLCGFERRDPSTLSGGEKQRLSIAAVAAMQPRLVVLDEPTTDLDPHGKREILELLVAMRDRGVAVVLIEHEEIAASYADRVVLMSDGRIVAEGVADHVLRDVDMVRRVGAVVGDLDEIAARCDYPGRFASSGEAADFLRGRVGAGGAGVDSSHGRGELLLEVEEVEFAYAGGPDVLRGVSFELRSGELVALVGPNGSGKTTLSKHCNGLLSPRSGSVRLDGDDLRDLSLSQVAGRVAYVFQNPDHQIFADSVLAEVRFALDHGGVAAEEAEARALRALAKVGLASFADVDPFTANKGVRQRLAVASVLVLEPRILVLDEPITGLDAGEQREMMRLLAELRDGGTSVLVITHTPWVVAEWSDRVVALESGGKIFDGATREFLAAGEIMQRCDFEPPPATRVGASLGLVVGSVDELWTHVGGGS